MKRTSFIAPNGQAGQVALEYALALLIVMGLAMLLVLFYQNMVQGNLYGSAGEQNQLFLLATDNKALGLHRVASLPIP